MLVAADTTLTPQDLALPQRVPRTSGIETLTLEESERYLLQAALERNPGSMQQVAKELDLSRSALYRRLVRHGLRKAENPDEEGA